MNLKRSPHRGTGRLELLDATLESYMNWRDKSRAVAESYRSWSVAVGSERDVAFDRYVAALDREEHAACGYRRLLELAREGNDPLVSAR
jgi:hypothetical protein